MLSAAFGAGWAGDALGVGEGLVLGDGLGGTGGGTLAGWAAGAGVDFNDFAGPVAAATGFFAGAGAGADFRAGFVAGAQVFEAVTGAGFTVLLAGFLSAGLAAAALAVVATGAFAFLGVVFVLSATEATDDLAEAGAADVVAEAVGDAAGLLAAGLLNLAALLELPLTDDGFVLVIR